MTLELATLHLDSTDRLSTGKRKPLPEPRPHQIEAIENVISGFQTANRGQLIMPCATGKTLICQWVKEKLKAKRTLVLVPSLGLLSQILNDWTSAARQQFDALCVCSDETVSRKDYDESITLISDLPFPAIRLSQNKTMGIIIIPIFIGQTDDAQAALETGNYKPIWNVLEALKSHDDRLSDELDQLRIELGAKRKRSVGANDLAKIVHFDLPTSVDENFAQSLRTHLVEKTTESWMFWYGLLQAFVNEYKHSRVLCDFKTNDGYRLGGWVHNQRQDKDKIDPDRRQRLESLPGWSWGVHSDQWEEGLSYLKEFVEREGHCRVFQDYKTNDGYRLGSWVSNQRTIKDKMEPDRRQRLESLPGWSWDARVDRWEEGFFYLKEFVEREGHCRVSQRHTTDDGYRLGSWVSNQRTIKDRMNPDRLQRLEALPTWSWNARSDKWPKGFSYLKEFAEREGHCRVPDGFKTDDGYQLGTWVLNQRRVKGKMEPDRRQCLESLPGWSWDAHSDKWQKGFSYLKEFVEREGHCGVPATYKTDDGYRLGSWVYNQRKNKDKMNSHRRQRLEAFPGWSWDVRSDPKWEPQDYAVSVISSEEEVIL